MMLTVSVSLPLYTVCGTSLPSPEQHLQSLLWMIVSPSKLLEKNKCVQSGVSYAAGFNIINIATRFHKFGALGMLVSSSAL